MLPALEKEVQLLNRMRSNKLKLMTLFCLADESVSNSLYQEYTNGRATPNTNNYPKCCKEWVNILEQKRHSIKNTENLRFFVGKMTL